VSVCLRKQLPVCTSSCANDSTPSVSIVIDVTGHISSPCLSESAGLCAQVVTDITAALSFRSSIRRHNS